MRLLKTGLRTKIIYAIALPLLLMVVFGVVAGKDEFPNPMKMGVK